MKHIPVLIAALVGFLMVFAFFVPPLLSLRQTAEEWFTIVATIALLLGAVNLCGHHLKQVSRQESGWGYSAVTLISFAATVGVGLLKVGVVPESAPNLNYAWSGQFQQEGGALSWIYDYLLSPIVATMFALLAFYVASAAFRAFRAKNVEAMLLLLTALIVLVGQTKDREITSFFIPKGTGETQWIPIADLTEFIRKAIVTAGQRAILIGISLGVAATSLRILLGLDRSYLGGEE